MEVDSVTEALDDLGCSHYKRKNKFVTPCCKKIYTCRFCHDENEDHVMNRKEVTELVCAVCNKHQKVQTTCEVCGVLFGKYSCLKCNLFEDKDRKQFHCDACGICRIGGADKYFHCTKCNMCLPIHLRDGHTCVENVSHSNCPVCLEDIHTSRIPCHIPKCGHLLHGNCFKQLLRYGLYACPVCQTSLTGMESLWKLWDDEVANSPMPDEYRDCWLQILCRDCHRESTVRFHVVGLKCSNCGSYNTCRQKGPIIRGYFRTGVRYILDFCNFLLSISRQLFRLPVFSLMYYGRARDSENAPSVAENSSSNDDQNNQGTHEHYE